MPGMTQEEQQQQDQRLKERMANIKHTLMVMSGKGGVGKTTVAVNLAYGLAQNNFKVGLLDVDIHGPDIAKMLGVEDKTVAASEDGIAPVRLSPNLSIISLALVGYDRDAPFIWRGPLKMGVIKQFLADVLWEELDYLVIDSPPGTGDEPLSVGQLITNMDGSIIVTTPQDVSILDSRKSINFSKQLKVPVIGVIENMSGLLCPHCGKAIDLFGTGGGSRAAEEMGVPFLGSIPIEPSVVRDGDRGRPFVAGGDDTATGSSMKMIIEKIISVTKSPA